MDIKDKIENVLKEEVIEERTINLHKITKEISDLVHGYGFKVSSKSIEKNGDITIKLGNTVN